MICRKSTGLVFGTCWLLLAAFFLIVKAGTADAGTLATPWVEGFNNKVRLLAGAVPRGSTNAAMAGVEISMPPGWKTYWLAPGEAGGIPPEFDWTGSENLASAQVLFPAPHRMIDKSGTSIGYKDHVIFPVAIAAKDKAKPVQLKLKVAFGACKDICIPAEAELQLPIPLSVEAAPELVDAVGKVPRVAPAKGSDAGDQPDPARDPDLTSWRIDHPAGKPKLVLDVTDPGGSGGDAFVTGPDGIYLPLPKKISDEAGKSIYEVDLSDGVDLKDLRGKVITATLAGVKGQSAFMIEIPENAAQK